MLTIFFSIVVVSLNPGEKLIETLETVAKQSFKDYEVIIKDGCSQDGVLEKAELSGLFERLNKITVVREKDSGIYDAMNQAVKHISGKYVMFLNCGDSFYNVDVLSKVAGFIKKQEDCCSDEKSDYALKTESVKTTDNFDVPYIFYGDQYNLLQDCIVSSAPTINDFTCFRNVPCHQLCFYDYRLFQKRAYNPKFEVRGDYEHFLYSIYKEQAKAIHMPFIICNYEGGGFSETMENRKKSKEEHREITDLYLRKKAVLFRIIMFLSMAGLRTKLAESKRFSGFYNQVKSFLYSRK